MAEQEQKTKKKLRWLKWLGIVLMVLVLLAGAGAVVGFHYATKLLKDQVVAALGPNSEVGEVKLSWSGVEVLNIRVKGPKGWPVDDALRATRLVVEPDLRSLLSKEIHISHITLEGGYLSILRDRKGKVRLLPGILDRTDEPKDANAAPMPKVVIGDITLKQGGVDFFDGTVRKVPHKISLEQLDAKLGQIALPDLTGQTTLQLDGKVKGVRHDGKLQLKGWTVLQSKDADVDFRLQNVDLLAFQPYLIKAAEVGVKRGDLALAIHAKVNKNRLNAPGSITLSNLEIGSGHGFGATFMGMPRQLVVSSLKDRQGKITVHFTLAGNINDPSFSLNEDITKRISSSMAEGLGISLGGLVKGVAIDPLRHLFGR